MRYIVSRDDIPGASRKLGYALLGLSCALAGSGALAWQNSNAKFRTARIQEAAPATPVNGAEDKPAIKAPTAAPAVTSAKKNPPAATKTATKPVPIQVEEETTAGALPPIINAPSATPVSNGTNRPVPTRSVAAKPATAKPSPAKPVSAQPSTAPAARTASKEKSNSLLPFNLPGFGGTKSPTADTTASSGSSTSTSRTPQRFNPSASAKALGNKTRSSKSSTKPDMEPTADTESVAVEMPEPTPARREPKLAERTQPEAVTNDKAEGEESVAAVPVAKPKPTVKPQPIVKPAPETSEPKVAAAPKPVVKPIAKPQPTVRATPQVSSAPKADRTKLTKVTRELAPLVYAPIKNVRPAGFQEVTPGQSKLTSIAQQLGEPISTEHQGDTTVMTYELGPFPKVEIILAGDVVDSVVIHLDAPVPEADVLKELGLSDFSTAEVTDEAGQVLGVAVPERGVALSYQGNVSERKVGEVVLATISAEPFLLRATSEQKNRYGNMLADCDFALGLDAASAEAHAIRARILMAVGRVTEARTAIEKAIKLDEGSADYRLLYANLLASAGDYDNALKMVETIATTPSVPPEFIAQAELQWGRMLADGPAHDQPLAIEHLTKAIKLSTPLAQSESAAVRRAALRTLLDANLSVACAIASGNYKRKPEVVPKWLNKADAIAQLALQEGADPYLQLYVPAKKLTAYSLMEEPIEPTAAVDAALSAGQELIAAATDPLYKQQLEWELGTALLAAVQIEHARGQFDLAMQYANNALVLLSDNAEHREPTPQREYLLGQMFFTTGALYAIGFEDHAEAVHYFLLAQPLLSQPLPVECQNDSARHGERFVSMGVSYWQNGNKQQAIELTLKGVDLLRKAVDGTHTDQQALVVPYNNLASMYRQLGNATEASKYADLAKRLEPSTAAKR